MKASQAHIIAVDDERHALDALSDAINTAVPDAHLACFTQAEEALIFAQDSPVDIAFLDIALPGTTGLSLARQLQDLHPHVNIVFVTGHSEYSLDAFGIYASGYLMKPVNATHVARELEHLRSFSSPSASGISVQCFGSFEVFFDGKPLRFSRTKAKELFAYLVDRQGALVSKKELAAILWEDEFYTRSKQIQLQTLVSSMIRAFDEVGAGSIIVRSHGFYALDVGKVSCDYYDYLAKSPSKSAAVFRGEYMSSYGWAEYTASLLSNSKHHRLL